MRRAAEGTHRWVYTLYPTNGYASDAEMSLQEFEDFYFGACLANDGDPVGRLEAGLGGVRPPRGVDPGTQGGARDGPRHRHPARGSRAARFIPCVAASTTCPTASSSPGPVEDSVEGEVTFHLPAVIGGREVTGVRLQVRVRQDRRRLRRAQRGLPDQAARHRRGRPPPGRAWASAPTTGSTAAPATSCSTRRSAARSTWPSAPSYPESGGTNESAVHTDLVCDLRQGGKIEVDGELFQEDGAFKV